MPSYDLSDYLADDTLTLNGIASAEHPKGKAYRIKSPSAKLGLQLQRLTQLQAQRGLNTPPSDEELTELLELIVDESGAVVDFNERLFGPTWQQMIDDGVSADRLQMIRAIVITHYGSGSAVARSIVEGAAGEAEARGNRAARRTAKRKTTARKTAGSKSSRASSAGTKSARAKASATTESSTSAGASEGQAKAV